MTIGGGNRLDGFLFEAWSKPSRQGVMGYCSAVVWQVEIVFGLAERPDNNSMLCGKFPTLWMDFQ
jgi:hypothetical protein